MAMHALAHLGQHRSELSRYARCCQDKGVCDGDSKTHGAAPGVVNDLGALGQPGLFEVGVIGLDTARRAPIPDMSIGVRVEYQRDPGGFSDQFAMPDYQKDAVTAYLQKLEAAGETPPASAFNSAGRAYPDVAALAGTQNPYCVAADKSFVGVGGTSASCPVTAGLFARINAERSAQGKPAMGFLNPFIYQNGDAFNDVKQGSVTGATGVKGFAALEGWDAATGFGTPNFPKVLAAAMKAAEGAVVV